MEKIKKMEEENSKESINLSFREAGNDELESITEIWWENIAQDGRDLKEDAKEQRLREYQDRIESEDDCFILAEAETKGVVGYIHCVLESNKYESKEGEDVTGWIKTLAVDKEMQGQRIGSKLIKQAEEYFKKKGVSKVYIKTNQVDFYEKAGFEKFTYILKKNLEN